MTLYTAVITRGDFAISCLLNAFTFYPYIILSPKKKLQRCPKDTHQHLRIRPRSTWLHFRVRILYNLQLNFWCHRGWKERHNQTKQRIDAHRNASSSKIMPNIATLFISRQPHPKKSPGQKWFFPHSLQSTTSLSLLLTILYPHAEISMLTTVRTFLFFFFE